MKQREKLLHTFAMAADLPGEALPGIPLLELAGEGRVLIENHRGVTAYAREEICVQVQYGCICICGENLSLARMTKEQLVITGRIDRIQLFRGR